MFRSLRLVLIQLCCDRVLRTEPSKLQDAGYRLGFDTIRVKFKPTAVTRQNCKEAGTDFAQALKKNQEKPHLLETRE
jgi:hypothetical protein